MKRKPVFLLALLFALLLLPACANAGASIDPAQENSPAQTSPAADPTGGTSADPSAALPAPADGELTGEPEAEPADDHAHQPAEEPAVVDGPDMLYCGNTVTTIIADGEEYSFWGDDSVALTDLLSHLIYDPDSVCRCMPEYTVDTEFGSGYGVNLTSSYARYNGGQAALTQEQVEIIRGIIERNCA